MKNKRMIGFFLAMIMAAAMVLQAVPASVFADDADKITTDRESAAIGPEEEYSIVRETPEGAENEVPEDAAKMIAEEPAGTKGVLAEQGTGGAYEAHSADQHETLGFTPWTSDNSLPAEAGNYYLTTDVTLNSTWTVPGPAEGSTNPAVTNLCLNGHHIKAGPDTWSGTM